MRIRELEGQAQGWKEKSSALDTESYAQLKAQLDTTNDDLSRYHSFTGFILCQELGLTEALRVWMM